MEIFLPFALFSNFSDLGNEILVHSDQTHLVISCILLLWYLPTLFYRILSYLIESNLWFYGSVSPWSLSSSL